VRLVIAYRRLIVYEYDLQQRPTVDIRPEIDVSMNFISAPDLAGNMNLRMHGTSIMTKEDFNSLAQGRICLAAQLSDDLIIGFCWLAFGDIYVSEIDTIRKLSPEEANIFNLRVLPEYRRKGISKAILSAACQYLKEKGFRKVSIEASSTNYASRRAIERVGFKETGALVFWRLLWIKHHREEWVSA